MTSLSVLWPLGIWASVSSFPTGARPLGMDVSPMATAVSGSVQGVAAARDVLRSSGDGHREPSQQQRQTQKHLNTGLLQTHTRQQLRRREPAVLGCSSGADPMLPCLQKENRQEWRQ